LLSSIPIIRGITSGFKSYLRGIKWLGTHPVYAIILYLPLLLASLFLYYGWGFLESLDSSIQSWALFNKPSVYWVWAWYICKWLLYALVRGLAFISAILVANILWAPVYEYVSGVIEKDITGKEAPSFTWKKQLLLILEEAKKVVFILVVSVVVALIPMVNILAFLVTAFLVGWDFFDYVPARHGMSFAERRKLAVSHFLPIMGLGIWLVIPFVQFFVYPLGIAGGTILSLEKMEYKLH